MCCLAEGHDDQLIRRDAMKSVIVLLMVFAITSTVCADLHILVNGEKNPSFEAGRHHTLGIWTDTNIDSWEGYDFALVAPTSFDTSIDYTSGIALPPYDTSIGIFLSHSTSASHLYSEIPAGTDGIYGSIAFVPGDPVIDAGAIIFNQIDLYIPMWPVGLPIYLYVGTGGSSLTLAEEFTVFGIPEPMTIGLLVLGALFLRKRKV